MTRASAKKLHIEADVRRVVMILELNQEKDHSSVESVKSLFGCLCKKAHLVVEGIDFAKLPVGTRFRCGDVVLELTQIGKECHNGCAIFQKMGECIMPREGVFTKVLKGGKVSVGDEMTVDKAMIFDTHAHYDDEAFDEDRFAMLEKHLLCVRSWKQ